MKAADQKAVKERRDYSDEWREKAARGVSGKKAPQKKKKNDTIGKTLCCDLRGGGVSDICNDQDFS